MLFIENHWHINRFFLFSWNKMDLHQVKLKNDRLMFSTRIYYLESWQLYFGKMLSQTHMEAQNIDDLKLCTPKQEQKNSVWEDIVKLPLPHLTYHLWHNTHDLCDLSWSICFSYNRTQRWHFEIWLEHSMLLSLHSPFSSFFLWVVFITYL